MSLRIAQNKVILSKIIRCRLLHTGRCVNVAKSNTSDILVNEQLSPELQRLYDRHKSAILYSSFHERNILRLGFVKQKMFSKRLQQKERHAALENANVRPFSLALKYWDDAKTEFDKKYVTETKADEEKLKADVVDEFAHNRRKTELLREFKRIQSDLGDNDENKSFLNDWMNDYEIFDDSDGNIHSQYGTPDPSVPVSKIPCYGCGALLQCADASLPGYLPSELFKGKTQEVLKTVNCQRCHFLKNYNTAINIKVSSEQYVEMLSTIEDKFALVVLMIDLLDFPCSLWPGIASILGTKRPIIVVGNKIDLLPKDSPNHINHVRQCLEDCIANSGIARTNVKRICLISAETGYGVEELITTLHNVWEYKGDVYLVGCTNVGKSTLFNALLRSDYCKVKASNIIQKATASPWPGTTIRLLKFPILRPSHHRLHERTQRLISQKYKEAAERKLRNDQMRLGNVQSATLIGHIGKTFEIPGKQVNDHFSMGKNPPPVLSIDENSEEYATSKWCFDTPGVLHEASILDLLTTEELLLTLPKKMINPRTFVLKPGMSLFLAGLGRVDFLDGADLVRASVYASHRLPIMIVETNEAQTIYNELLGTEYLGVPIGDAERLARWPALSPSEVFEFYGEGTKIAACDVLLSSAGWVGLCIPSDQKVHFKVWTPEGRGIYVRHPSLIPFGYKLHGGRIKGSLAYRTELPFVKPVG